MIIREEFTNVSEGTTFADESYETPLTTPGELYRWALSEYGRCTGKVYVDGSDGEAVHVGWIFQGRDRYQDSDQTYLREVWVTYSAPPV